jgi:hypothetical protein
LPKNNILDGSRSANTSVNTRATKTIANTAASSTSKFKELMLKTTHGGTSLALNARGFLGKVGGGSVANCITDEYAANFLIENRLKD